MDRLVTVRVEIEVVVAVQDPVMRSAETQVADFVLPALKDLEEATMDVKSVTYKFTES